MFEVLYVGYVRGTVCDYVRGIPSPSDTYLLYVCMYYYNF